MINLRALGDRLVLTKAQEKYVLAILNEVIDSDVWRTEEQEVPGHSDYGLVPVCNFCGVRIPWREGITMKHHPSCVVLKAIQVLDELATQGHE